MKLYLDGQLVDSDATYTGGITNNTRDLILGSSNDGPIDAQWNPDGLSGRFSGYLDQFALFDTAVGDTRVFEHYFAEAVSHTANESSNADPVLAQNNGLTVDEGATDTIGNTLLQVTDVDNTAPELTYTVTTVVANGTLKRDGVTLGVNDTFTQTDIDANLITYQHDDSQTTSDSFIFTVSDGAGGTIGATTFSITVNPVNDAPVNTVPIGQSVNEDDTLVFSVANGNAITLADVDAGTNSVELTLSVTQGVLTLAALTGLTGTGNGTASLTYTGTLTDLNAALDGLVYTPATDYNGPDTLTVTTDDLGNTGTPGTLTDQDTVATTVNLVNDQPGFAASDPAAVDENAGPISVPNWIASFSPGGGSDEAGQLPTYLISNISDPTFFATAPSVDAAGTLTYEVAADRFGTVTFDVRVQEDGGTANGGVDTSPAQNFIITVNEVPEIDLVEGTELVKSGSADVLIPLDIDSVTNEGLVFDFSGLKFNEGSQTVDINDAFELALLDVDGNPAVATVGQGRDAFFNFTEGQGQLIASGVDVQNLTQAPDESWSGRVVLDVDSGLAGQTLTLVARLLNNDADDTTAVSVDFNLSGHDTHSRGLYRFEQRRSASGSGRKQHR